MQIFCDSTRTNLMIVRKWRTRRHTDTVGGDVIRTLKQLQENAKQLKLDRKEIMCSL